MPAHNWMSSINDDRLLSEITMPGSHDAGIHADVAEKRGIAPERFAITQDVGIYDQCMRGSRFFDVRVDVGTGQGPGGQTYHGGKQTGTLGQSLDDTLRDVRRFLSTYGRECVILRFSKTKGNVVEVVNRVQTILGPGAGGVDLLFRTNTNIAAQKISALRLKAICVFEETHDAIKATSGLHRFSRYDAPPLPSGLVACGKYSNSSRLREVVNGQVAKIDEHANHAPNSHLFVLYWTQTFNVLRPWKQGFTMDIRKVSFKPPNFQKEQQQRRITGGAHHNMDYLKRLVSMGTDARSGQQKTRVLVTSAADRRRIMPNVIMYDFVNAQMSNEIISLNDPVLLGHVVEDEYDGVAQMFA
jgi:hypothetical protein